MGQESPWGWMLVGLCVGLLGAGVLVFASSAAVTTAGIAVAALGGTIVFVSGVAAGVANGMARHEYLRTKR